MIITIFILSICATLFFAYYGIKYERDALFIATSFFILAALIAGVDVDSSNENKELRRKNTALTLQLDSLRTKKTPCPDTHYIFLPPIR